jgi:glycosyltransferase involved in cell wall biosynthesis
MTSPALKVLLELRPALDGHAGIPQETRLLFQALSQLEDIDLEGLLQSSTRMLAKGIPLGRHSLSRDRQMNRLSRVVVSLHSRPDASYLERGLTAIGLAVAPIRSIFATLLLGRQALTVFDADLFRDFIWRALFSRTLPSESFDLVTRKRFRVARFPWTAVHAGALITRRFGRAVYPRLDTTGVDVMIAETPYPGRVRRPTRLVVRYHDAVPLLMPHTISDRSYHQASHYHALRRNVADGAWFACVSDTTRRDLISIFPQAEERAITIPNMISSHYFRDSVGPQRIPEVLRLRRHSTLEGAGAVFQRGGQSRYLLMVSTIEPRKNHLTLLSAWEQLRAAGHADLQLILVGSLGWDHMSIVKKLRPWLVRGGLHILEDVPSGDLRLLYRHASVTVCPSFGEGFDYSGVEAMRSGGIVAASDIPVHHDVFGQAAQYFNPYSVTDMVNALATLLDPAASARREQLVAEGETISARYLPERILPHWREFLENVRAAR